MLSSSSAVVPSPPFVSKNLAGRAATMSSTKATDSTTTTSGPGGGGQGTQERKVVVETVEYRSSAGQAPGEAEKRPVEVVHEHADGSKGSSLTGAKQGR